MHTHDPTQKFAGGPLSAQGQPIGLPFTAIGHPHQDFMLYRNNHGSDQMRLLS